MNGYGDWDGIVPPIDPTNLRQDFGGKRVAVHLYTQSEPIVITDVGNTYEKGSMFCVLQNGNGTVYKFPLQHIFRVTEEQ